MDHFSKAHFDEIQEVILCLNKHAWEKLKFQQLQSHELRLQRKTVCDDQKLQSSR